MNSFLQYLHLAALSDLQTYFENIDAFSQAQKEKNKLCIVITDLNKDLKLQISNFMWTLQSSVPSAAAGPWNFWDQSHFHSHFFVLWIKSTQGSFVPSWSQDAIQQTAIHGSRTQWNYIVVPKWRNIDIAEEFFQIPQNLKQGLQVKLLAVSYKSNNEIQHSPFSIYSKRSLRKWRKPI